ncbi:head-tail connector protein [Maricaulis sp.]|uniref:head-tail connector protein n=1 Tax=Maricaulis sp. TaxID=1486257 RepID=UPI003A913F95
MSLSLVTPPAAEPIALDQVRARLRISDTSQDARLTHLIRSARQRVEGDTGRACLSQTWLERRDAWDGDGRLCAFGTQFKLPKPPLISIDAITTYAADDTATNHDPADFFIDTASEPGRLALRPNGHFPQPARNIDGIEIRFTCGYGETAEDVPGPLVEAIGQLVEAMFDGGLEVGMPASVKALLSPWWRISL